MDATQLVALVTPVTLVVVYAMIGWVAEVIFAAVTEGTITNRGFLAGPYCPIYGFGALGMTALLGPVADNPLLVFLGAMVVASLLELVTGWALEKIFHRRWWDYSDRPFNVGGYICLSFSLMWGVAGILLMEVLHPAITRLLAWLNPWVVLIGLGIVVAVMLVDLAATVSAALKLDGQLKALKEADDRLRASTDVVSTRIGRDALDFKEKADADLTRLKEHGDETRQRMEAKLSRTTRRQLRAFPRLRSTSYPDQLDRLRAEHGEPAPAGARRDAR